MKKVIFYMAFFIMAWTISMLTLSFLTVVVKVVVGLVYLHGEIKFIYSFEEFVSNMEISAFSGVMSVAALFLGKRVGRRQ